MNGRLLPVPVAVATLALAAVPAFGQADRPAGVAFSWGQELRQQKVPGWRPNRNPFSAPRWNAIATSTLLTSGRNGLWISGSTGLPFDLPIRDTEPVGWFTPANYARLHRQTGIKFDVNLELKVAKLARDRKLHRSWNVKLTIPARRYNMLSPGWQATMLREIRRLVPRHRNLPYANYYTGVDEPMVFPPFGPAERTPFARRFLADVQARYGHPAPDAGAAPTADAAEGLRWLAFNRYTGERYFALRKEQADLIHRLDPQGQVSTNSYAFIDGFIPWDYTKLAEFADVVELDPYPSYDEAVNPGRGRYNQGFGTKLMSDLTGKRIRTIVQAFPYKGYDPRPEDLWTWSTQALRAGATDLSLYGENSPKYTRPKVYQSMLDIGRSLRGARLPAPPIDPTNVVVYATASEAQGSPESPFPERPRTRANQLYTTYAVLGELAHAAFSFDADTRLVADPGRLAQAKTIWLPRGETLDRPFADALVAWVRSGGTLIVTDPDALTRTPSGESLADIRGVLIGAGVVPGPVGAVAVAQGALAPGLPVRGLSVPVMGGRGGVFDQVPADARIVGTNSDGSAAILLRTVEAGQVLAVAPDLMVPATLDAPGDLVAFARALLDWRQASRDVPAWRFELAGNPAPGRLPWPSAVAVSALP